MADAFFCAYATFINEAPGLQNPKAYQCCSNIKHWRPANLNHQTEKSQQLLDELLSRRSDNAKRTVEPIEEWNGVKNKQWIERKKVVEKSLFIKSMFPLMFNVCWKCVSACDFWWVAMTPLVNTATGRLKELAQNKTQTVFRVCSCSDALIQPSCEAQLGAASECCDASLINSYFARSHREERVCLLSSVSGWKLVDAFYLSWAHL